MIPAVQVSNEQGASTLIGKTDSFSGMEEAASDDRERTGSGSREYPKNDKRIGLSVPDWTGMELEWIALAMGENGIAARMIAELEGAFSQFTGSGALSLSSGTAGLHLGLKLLLERFRGLRVSRVGGDQEPFEVVVPTLTFVASCNPILYEGARPVFIDSERSSWNLDPELLAGFLKKRAERNRLPAAVVVVHLFGQTADMDSILGVCRPYEIPVLEDSAEALGSVCHGRPAGSLGDVGVFSFNQNKIITGTTGGMLVTQNREWIEKARHWSVQARDPGTDYLHSELGYNYRMSPVIAGMVQAQFQMLRQRVEQRRAVFQRYQEALADLPGIEGQREVGRNSRHSRWLSCFLFDDQKFGMTQTELIRFLGRANIEARPVWKPMHTQKLYERYECIRGEVAEELNRRGICLPSSSSLTESDQRRVVEMIRAAAGGR